MKLLKKTLALMFAMVVLLGIFQTSLVAYGNSGSIEDVELKFALPAEGDPSNPTVQMDEDGVVCDDIAFMTTEKGWILPHDMIEGQEYYAVIKLHADADNGYFFYNEANVPVLSLGVNDEYLDFISDGMPDDLKEGYFVSDPDASAPYNNITILKKFEAQKRTYSYYIGKIAVEGDEKIKVGETTKIIVSEIDLKKDRILEYTWAISDGVKQEIRRSATDAFDFSSVNPGTYSIFLAQVKIEGDTLLTYHPDDYNQVEITVTATSFSAKINADKEKYKVGETIRITATDIENQNLVTEYGWEISNEAVLVGKPNSPEGTINFTPDKAGTYKINLARILRKDGTSLTSKDSYIIVTVEEGSGTGVPKTGDEFKITFWLIMLVLSTVSFSVTLLGKRRVH